MNEFFKGRGWSKSTLSKPSHLGSPFIIISPFRVNLVINSDKVSWKKVFDLINKFQFFEIPNANF